MAENMQQEQQSIGQLLNVDAETEATLQADTQKFIAKGTKLIHSEKSRDKIIGMLESGGANPLEAVANTTVALVTRLDEAARQSGAETHDLVKISGALDLLQQVAEVGAASKAIPQLSEEEMQTSFSVAVEKYISGEIKAGRIDPKALQGELQKGIQQMPPEEQAGLDQQLKGINQTAMASTGRQAQQGGLLNGV